MFCGILAYIILVGQLLRLPGTFRIFAARALEIIA